MCHCCSEMICIAMLFIYHMMLCSDVFLWGWVLLGFSPFSLLNLAVAAKNFTGGLLFFLALNVKDKVSFCLIEQRVPSIAYSQC